MRRSGVRGRLRRRAGRTSAEGASSDSVLRSYAGAAGTRDAGAACGRDASAGRDTAAAEEVLI